MKVRPDLIFLGVAVLAIAFLPDQAQAQTPQKTFVYCSEGSPSSFNPQVASDGTTFNASSHTVYNRLIEFKQGSTEIESKLALSWAISKDGLKYTFKLRPRVQFHSNDIFKPSRDFNADDVIYSFQVQKDAKNPLRLPTANYEYFVGMEMDKIIAQVKKINDLTVEFTLTRPEAPFLANLAMDFASILSKEYAETLLKQKKDLQLISTKPIGTGPFVFKSYQKDTLIRYTANANYFDGVPKIQNLVFAITPDPSVRLQKLKAGECHFVADPAPSDLDTIAKNKNLKLMEKEGLNIGYLAINTSKKPFDNVKVRQAIHHALNRQQYITAVFLGHGVVAKNPIPPIMWSYNNKVVDYEFNPSKAKALLKEAGYANGFETELWTMPVSRAYNPAGKKMGELMQSDLAAVGIKVKLATYDWPTYLEKARKGEHQLIQIGWTGDNGDPDNFLHILLGCAAVESGSNYARWCYKPYNDLVVQAKQLTNQGQRSELYQKAQVIFKQQAPWVTLVHGQFYRAMSSKVTGYAIHPFGGDIFDKVDLK
ncbi:MAG: ABC transporter substrate-binding protein [Pseudobdellovibrionaceae bacterium]